MHSNQIARTAHRSKAYLSRSMILTLSLAASTAFAAQAPSQLGLHQTMSNRSATSVGADHDALSKHALTRRNPSGSAASSTGSAVYVGNCNGSGPGSLPAAISSASNGATIDMSQLTCDTIQLDATLVIHQNDLTLLGQPGPFVFLPGFYIIAPAGYRAIHHDGTGTLVLNSINLSQGHVASSGTGACIQSDGNVTLNTTSVHDCTAQTASNSSTTAKGGAIAAAGDVLLDGFSSVFDSSATASLGPAYGGGIWAGGKVTLKLLSYVHDNRAESADGEVKGGGIFATVWADVFNSSVYGNTAHVASGGLFAPSASGGGIYSAGDSYLEDATIEGNYVNSGNSLGGANGGGVYTETGVYLHDGSVIRANEASGSGGGVYTNGQLQMTESTVYANEAVWGSGAMYVAGNVHIDQSTIARNISSAFATIQLGENATTTMTIHRSTISENEVASETINGAALFLQHDAQIEHCSIVYNFGHNPTETVYGAGISLDNNVSAYLWNTLVAGNGHQLKPSAFRLSDLGLAKDTSGGLIDAASSYNLVNWSDIPIPNIRFYGWPQMGPLQDNGGLTWTHLPNYDSYMVGVGSAGVSSIDQRGLDRTVGVADIGAVELTTVELDRIFADGFE